MQSSTNQPDIIDTEDSASISRWTKELSTTEIQLRDAVTKVGNKAADVEMHLKGARSTTNDDRMEQTLGKE
ncbi:MAG: DUF3606 domain-containing protein [Hyphomicrobiales bacterium]|nr:MAG: DUF3606 domain-containing protein [Hyphomicrobiales bacterium]